MKKKLIAAFLVFAMMASYIFTTPLRLSVSAADSSAPEYNYGSEKIGLSMYHFPMWANSYNNSDIDADDNGAKTTTWENYQAEITAILDAGYVNTLYLNKDLYFSEVLALIKQSYSGQKFWIFPGYFYSSKQTISQYIESVDSYVTAIKEAGVWDNFLGFHWDEPLDANNMTSEDFFAMTQALHTRYYKRNDVVFTTNAVETRLSDKVNGESIIKYVTDIGFDQYEHDTGTSSGKNYYKNMTATMLSNVDHPVNLWFYSCADSRSFGLFEGSADEEYFQEHLTFFSELLASYSGNENVKMGGVSLYTYRTWSDKGLDYRLPESKVRSTNSRDIYTDYAEQVKALKSSYDSTTTNVVYKGYVDTRNYGSGLNDTASYLMNVYDDASKNATSANHNWASFLIGGQNLDIIDFDGETFITLDTDESQLVGDKANDKANVGFYFNSFFDGFTKYDSGLRDSIEQSKLTYFAMRVKLSAGETDQTSSFNMLISADEGSYDGTYFERDLSGAYLIDKATGKVTNPGWSGTGFKFGAEAFDGWILVPFSAWTNSNIYSSGKFNSDIESIKYFLTPNSGWQNRNLYLGDIFVVESDTAFKSVHSAPEISVSSKTGTSITMTSASGVVYSLDGVDFSNTTGEFTGLTAEKTYTVYAKYANGTHVTSIDVYTTSNPYSSGLGDTASYLMDVYDDRTTTFVSKNTGASNCLKQGTDGANSLPIVNFNGETFLQFLVDEDWGSPNVNVFFNTFFKTSFESGYNRLNDYGIKSEIDKTNLTHFAFRVKIGEGTEGVSNTFSIQMHKRRMDSPSEDPYGPIEQDLSDAYLIDKATGAVIDPGWNGSGFTFGAEEFDGWIVVPFDAWDSASYSVSDSTKNPTGFSLLENGELAPELIRMRYQIDSSYRSAWYNSQRSVYIGDIFVIESTDAFDAVHGAPVINETTGDGYIDVEAKSGIEYSISGSDEWVTGTDTISFTGLETNKTYTIYAKNKNTGLYTTKRVTVGASNPYASGLNDTASYLMDVYDDRTNTTSANNGSINNITKSNGGLPIVKDDSGETFIKLLPTTVSSDYPNVHVFFNSFFDGCTKDTTDLRPGIDKTKITHFAFRVKIDAGTEGAADTFHIAMQKKYSGSYSDKSPWGPYEHDLSDVYLIDKATGAVIDPGWTGTGITFGEEAFDGWIVMPFEAWDVDADTEWIDTFSSNRKFSEFSLLKDGVIDPDIIRIKYIFEKQSNWLSRSVYIGDAFVIEDTNAFNEAHKAAALTINKTSLTLEQNISLNFKADAQALSGYENIKAHVTFGEGEDQIVEEIPGVSNGTDYVFSFKNIGAEFMGSKATVYLTATKNNVEYTGATIEYSVADYCYNKLEEHRLTKDDSALKLKSLIVNLLNYGSAVQTYIKYNTDNLVNANLLNSEKSYGTESVPDMSAGLRGIYGDSCATDEVKWVAANLSFENQVKLIFKFKLEGISSTEGLTLKVSRVNPQDASYNDSDADVCTEFRANGGSSYAVYYGGVHAGEMNTNVYVTVYKDGVQVSDTLVYAISSYARQKYEAGNPNNKLSNVVLEMMRYGDAAVAYALVASNS